MRQRAVSRPIAPRKGTFYQSIRSIAAQRAAPYDAALLPGSQIVII
jgi:hypothetical protein